MSDTAGRPTTRIDPETAWTIVADSPLKGLTMAREAGTVLAWDEGNQLYLFNARGETLTTTRVPGPVAAAAISDEGGTIALLVESGEAGLWILSADFEVAHQRPVPPDASFVALDPYGRYLAVGGGAPGLHFYTRYGRPAGRLETLDPLGHFCFVADRPMGLAAAPYGSLLGIELEGARGGERLDAEIVWHDRLMSNIGRLALSGDASMVLASCYTLGIQRFDARGRNEGSYHLGGTVSHAVPDFPGRSIAAATLEGELAVMNSAGNVRWRVQLARPAIALEMGPLGRYLVYGHATGEIVRLDLFGGGAAAATQRRAPSARRGARAANAEGGGGTGTGASADARARVASGGTARTASGSAVQPPQWVVPVVEAEDQAQTAVMVVHDDPPLIALFTSPRRLRLYDLAGRQLGETSDLSGVGRTLRGAPGWLAAATDRQVALFDLRRMTRELLDANLVQLTHLAARPDDFGLVLVQERDRIGRLTAQGRWVWKRELRGPIEEMALGAYGFVAVTSHDGRLIVFDPAGEPGSQFRFDPSDPPLLIEAPEGAPPNVAWVTFTRRAQMLRGHDLRGAVVWERPTPWEGWALFRLGEHVLATSADGRALACAGSGELETPSGAAGEPNDVFAPGPDGEILRLTRKGVHLIAATLEGRVRFRSVVDEPFGPLAASAAGVAVLLGRSLAWFPHAAPALSKHRGPG